MKFRKNAFTLIELLVVISVIALLVSILLPALNSARQAASGAVCLTNQKSLVLAWLMYKDANKDLIPNAVIGFDSLNRHRWSWVQHPQDVNGNLVSSVTSEDYIRGIQHGVLYKYLENYKAYNCPGDRRNIQGVKTVTSYNVQDNMNGYETSGTYDVNGKTIKVRAEKYTQIHNPYEKYVFVEENDNRNTNHQGAWMGPWLASNRWGDTLAAWHNNKCSLGFADGRAELYQMVDPITITNARNGFLGPTNGFPEDPRSGDFAYFRQGYIVTTYGTLGW
jgi:prepilin-type N-terminal cleavage/methylation domain-containing protein